jgi:hypothetical protein
LKYVKSENAKPIVPTINFNLPNKSIATKVSEETSSKSPQSKHGYNEPECVSPKKKIVRIESRRSGILQSNSATKLDSVSPTIKPMDETQREFQFSSRKLKGNVFTTNSKGSDA